MATLTRSLTYAQLVAEIAASTLHKGESITITDYATTHFITDGLVAQVLAESVPVEITGGLEPLIVLATSQNTIGTLAKSVLFPNDIIHYDWNAANWMDNINFVTGEPPILISGFKGVITYREDTILNNSANHDFRNAKNRLWSIDQPEWSNTPGDYLAGSWVKVTGEKTLIYIAIDTCVATDVPGVATNKWIEVLDITNNVYLSPNSVGMKIGQEIIIPVNNALDFSDFGIFGSVYGYCKNVNYSKGVIDLAVLMD